MVIMACRRGYMTRSSRRCISRRSASQNCFLGWKFCATESPRRDSPAHSAIICRHSLERAFCHSISRRRRYTREVSTEPEQPDGRSSWLTTRSPPSPRCMDLRWPPAIRRRLLRLACRWRIHGRWVARAQDPDAGSERMRARAVLSGSREAMVIEELRRVRVCSRRSRRRGCVQMNVTWRHRTSRCGCRCPRNMT